MHQLGGEVAPLGQGHDAVGRAEGQRHDGHRGLATAGGYEAAAIAEKEIFYVVSLVIRVYNGSLGIVAHATRAEQVDAELLLVDGESPFLLCTGGVEKFR